jgi:hypothetical protein
MHSLLVLKMLALSPAQASIAARRVCLGTASPALHAVDTHILPHAVQCNPEPLML